MATLVCAMSGRSIIDVWSTPLHYLSGWFLMIPPRFEPPPFVIRVQLRLEQQRKQLEVELEAANVEELERRKKAIAEGRG